MTDPIDVNPYAPPTTVSESPASARKPPHRRWLRVLYVIQSAVIVGGIAAEVIEIESILGSGPIFALVGCAIAILAYRERNTLAILFGISAVVFALLIFFVINLNHWGPAAAKAPVTLLSLAYAAAALPVSLWLFYRQRPRQPPTEKER